MSDLILTLDVGTSSLRTTLFDTAGEPLPQGQMHLSHKAHVTTDGGVDLMPDTLLANTLAAIDGTLAALPAGCRVRAVALDTLWHSVLGVDGDGAPLTPLYTWADTRAGDAAARLRTILDENAVHSRTGCMLRPAYLPAKLAWIAATQPDIWKRVVRWLSFGEFLYLHLFGQPICSLSMASGTGLFDVHRCEWDAEVLRAIALAPTHLSPLVDMTADDALTAPRPEWRERWPALDGALWFPALGDGACSNIGSGCATPDRIALMVGTSSAARVVLQSPDATAAQGLWFYRVDRQRPIIGGALSEGGNIYAWLRSTLYLDALPRLEETIAAMEPDAHGLTVLPFLAGERSPNWSATARGAVVGLTLATSPSDILRASLEAIAYRFALVFEQLSSVARPGADVIASGGALLHSPAWIQIIADVLGKRVVALGQAEASSRGVALLALEALGLARADGLPVEHGTTYEPTPAHAARYREAIARQADLYTTLVDA